MTAAQNTAGGTIVVAQYGRFGSPKELTVVDAPAPSAGPGELIVKVTAISVNRIDTSARAGRSKFMTGRRMPQPTGLDFSGEVTQVGQQVSGFRPGQQVWGFLGTDQLGKHGTAATQIAISADLAAPAPTSHGLANLAALPLVAVTAWQTLEELQVKEGSRLLVVGGAGGVGSTTVQVARARGAAADTISSARHQELLQRLGAGSRFDPDPAQWSGLAGCYDAVLDTTGKNLWALRRTLTRSGRMITISPAGMATSIISKVLPGPSIVFWSVKPSRTALDQVAALIDAGLLHPVIRARFPLRDIAQAHALVETGHGEGKVLIDIS
ncbi:NADP-dependent oxidoreductase [Actinomyces sp.]|uniref:NADP-dependent oxidoreductase n=1 Tax=Actinomyces sp. TaxID=29317 RepID=UPI0026DC927F|nr:NADP-dependent oxidoreductase [Actinomyces sp.]MDO4899288.1 NADP-dependent oxidoreductase [Actinomyces sp.]